MAESAVIRPAGQSDSWEFAHLAPDATKDAFCGTLKDVALRCRRHRVAMLVPGSAVTMHTVQVPARTASEIRMAVPFALEERLADSIEAMHFAIGARAADGSVSVAVIAREVLWDYLHTLDQAGIRPASMIPEPLALPWQPGTRSVLLGPDAAVVRSAATSGYSIEPQLLRASMQRTAEPKVPIRLWCNTDDVIPEGEIIERRPLPAVLAALFVEGLRAQPCGLNLLQGEHAFRPLGDWRRWCPAAAVLATALLVHVGWSYWDVLALHRESDALAARAESLFHETFPNVKRIVNLEVQAAQQLAALRVASARSDFLTLFAHAGSVLEGEPAVRVEGIRFKDGEIELRVGAPDVETLRLVLQRLSGSAGIRAELRDAESAAGVNTARLVIMAAQS